MKDTSNQIKMEKHFLTNKRVIKGKFYNYLELLFFKMKKRSFSNLKNYKYIKSFNKYSDNKFSNNVSLYKDLSQKMVVIRRFYYFFKNLKYEQILNEYNMMRLLEHIKTRQENEYQISFPRMISFTDINNEIMMVREYLEGNQLRNKERSIKIKSIKVILNHFLLLTEKISKEEKKILPTRTAWYTFSSFPIALFRATIKNPYNILLYLKLFIIFYFQFLGSHRKQHYVLAHRDLHSNNILIKGHKIQILDSEIMVLAEQETDIAIISRCYSDEVNQETISNLIATHINDKKRFMRLSIYYAIQLLANEPKKSNDYKQTYSYLRNVFPKITSKLFFENNVFNVFNYFVR